MVLYALHPHMHPWFGRTVCTSDALKVCTPNDTASHCKPVSLPCLWSLVQHSPMQRTLTHGISVVQEGPRLTGGVGGASVGTGRDG